MLQTHYRQPIDWTFDSLVAARNELAKIFLFARSLYYELDREGKNILDEIERDFTPSEAVVAALADDLNTPKAIAAIREMSSLWSSQGDDLRQTLRDLMFLGVVREDTRYIIHGSSIESSDCPRSLTREIADIGYDYRVAMSNGDMVFVAEVKKRAERLNLEFNALGPVRVAVIYAGPSASETVEELIATRNAARAAKNWAESDRIRDELAGLGIALKDNKDGTTTWEVKR
jgi:cysteinyl-tRNA synthetase